MEKMKWEGEFTLRSDPWAGLIASCGSFFPMVHQFPICRMILWYARPVQSHNAFIFTFSVYKFGFEVLPVWRWRQPWITFQHMRSHGGCRITFLYKLPVEKIQLEIRNSPKKVCVEPKDQGLAVMWYKRWMIAKTAKTCHTSKLKTLRLSHRSTIIWIL